MILRLLDKIADKLIRRWFEAHTAEFIAWLSIHGIAHEPEFHKKGK
jgi:hypothetical protein